MTSHLTIFSGPGRQRTGTAPLNRCSVHSVSKPADSTPHSNFCSCSGDQRSGEPTLSASSTLPPM